MTSVRLDPALTLVQGDNNAAVSAAGTTQTDATELGAYHAYVTTCAAGAGVKLKAVEARREYTVANATSNALLVYPWTGGQFNGVTANLPVSIPPNAAAFFKVQSSTKITAIVGSA